MMDVIQTSQRGARILPINKQNNCCKKEGIYTDTRKKYMSVDANQPRNTSKDPLQVPNGPMTRSNTKTLKDALNALVLKVSTNSELEGPLEYQEEILVHLIHVQEGSNTTLFGQ